MPFNPAVVRGKAQVDVVTSWACLPVVRRSLPQDNAHLENHSRIHLPSEFRRANLRMTLSGYHVVFAPLYIATSNVAFAITHDDIVEILVCKDV